MFFLILFSLGTDWYSNAQYRTLLCNSDLANSDYSSLILDLQVLVQEIKRISGSGGHNDDYNDAATLTEASMPTATH
ncbi:hypothetical protein Trydic_g17120 [Trypoxylus dichotomus]